MNQWLDHWCVRIKFRRWGCAQKIKIKAIFEYCMMQDLALFFHSAARNLLVVSGDWSQSIWRNWSTYGNLTLINILRSKLNHSVSSNHHNMKPKIKKSCPCTRFLIIFFQLFNAPLLNMIRLHLIGCHLKKAFDMKATDENKHLKSNLEMEKNT